jgi:hypothetical protein
MVAVLLFLKLMTCALVPFSYLVIYKRPKLQEKILNIICQKPIIMGHPHPYSQMLSYGEYPDLFRK